MLQLTYISTARRGIPVAVQPILEVSRRNNRRDGITGLLHFNGVRFLQVLEGPEDKVTAALARISADPRHIAVVTLSRRVITTREFGDWDMAWPQAGEDQARFVAKVGHLVANAAINVRATFESFAQLSPA